jgi:DNA-binding GntR family transcriptional regulator
MSMLRIETKPDLVAQTHDAIRNAIMSGDLPPCAPLAQEDLASTLGVSRQPISHALVLLKQEGLIVDRGRKGQMVAPIDVDKLLALYQVRGALDRLAARLAAAKGLDGKSRLLDLVREGTAATNRGDVSAVVAADIAFHTALNELSGNAEISATANGFWPHMARSMRVVLEDRDRWLGIWSEHEAIARAVFDGNVDEAGELAAQHAEKAGEATHRRLLNEKS